MNKNSDFGILNNISEYVALVQITDSLGNVNHAVSVIGKWISDSNYEKYLPFNIELLNLICACYNEDESFAIFQEVFDSVSYIDPK